MYKMFVLSKKHDSGCLDGARVTNPKVVFAKLLYATVFLPSQADSPSTAILALLMKPYGVLFVLIHPPSPNMSATIRGGAD
jgi:hypothetical protein